MNQHMSWQPGIGVLSSSEDADNGSMHLRYSDLVLCLERQTEVRKSGGGGFDTELAQYSDTIGKHDRGEYEILIVSTLSSCHHEHIVSSKRLLDLICKLYDPLVTTTEYPLILLAKYH